MSHPQYTQFPTDLNELDPSLNTEQWDRIMKHPAHRLEQILDEQIPVIPAGWTRDGLLQVMKRNLLGMHGGSADAVEKALDDLMNTAPERTFGRPVGTIFLLFIIIWLIRMSMSMSI